MNLLKETLRELRNNGKGLRNILWCEQDDCYFSWDDFKELADLDYDERSGTQLIAPDLRIYGRDFWLERWFLDNQEGWNFISITPDKPSDYKKPESLIVLK